MFIPQKISTILKVVNFVVGFLILGLVYYSYSSKDYIDEDSTVEYAVSMHYDFKILSAKESNYYEFLGMTREGYRVNFKLPKLWNLENSYSVGDSICKMEGDSTLRVVTRHGSVVLPMNVQVNN